MTIRARIAISIAATCALLGPSATASARPILFPNIPSEIALQQSARTASAGAAGSIQPPAPPCPENGVLYPPPGGAPVPTGNCGVAQPVATSTPWPGNMAYYGGAVQTHPREYLVLWGWGQGGAFPKQACSPEQLTEGSTSATVACDPDGAAKYLADFLAQMGGTRWAGVSTQYYQSDPSGNRAYVSNDQNVLAGIWVDDANPANLSKTSSSNPAGPTNTYTQLAAEASRAAQHFGVSPGDMNANFIIAQAPAFSDPNALNTGYCAFHDFTEPGTPGNGYYDDPSVTRHIAYTNLPYQLAPDLAPVCGKDVVNPAPRGDMDGFSIVLGHEVEEAVTDPGAESDVGGLAQGTGTSVTYYGAWYDATDPNENGDKCAWVGVSPTGGAGGTPAVLPVPGAPGNITGNAGETFAVQSLWSNAAAGGSGYCSGVPSSDLPGSLAGEPPY